MISEMKWERVKQYVNSIPASLNFQEQTAQDVVDMVVCQMEYQETIDDEGNSIMFKKGA
jgi:hypothetical protein